jgi:hypothetical protein
VLPARVVVGDGQDLLVRALVVAHVEHAEHAGVDGAAREGRLAEDDDRIEVVTVERERVGDEAVVARVAHRGEQHPVEDEGLPLEVPLVLVAGPHRDLDEDLDGLVAHVSPPPSRAASRHRPVRTVTRAGPRRTTVRPPRSRPGPNRDQEVDRARGRQPARLHPARPGRRPRSSLADLRGQPGRRLLLPEGRHAGLHHPGLRHPRPVGRVRGGRRGRARRLPRRRRQPRAVRGKYDLPHRLLADPERTGSRPTAPGASRRCTARSTRA